MSSKPIAGSKPSRRRSTIRRSTDADLKAIHLWLLAQSKRNDPDTFLCNWRLTKDCHRDGELLVYVDGESGVPVAYQWGGLIRPGILEVRYDMRGKGIGRRLVERRIREAYKRDLCFLLIQCKPSSSIPFWKRMGFTLFNTVDGENYAYRLLKKTHQLPTEAAPVSVAIRFYPENRKWSENVAPLCIAKPAAVRTPDNVVHLSERVFCFKELYPDTRDPVVEIEVSGQLLYCDKAKYEEAQRIGVRRCPNGFFIDHVFPHKKRELI